MRTLDDERISRQITLDRVATQLAKFRDGTLSSNWMNFRLPRSSVDVYLRNGRRVYEDRLHRTLEVACIGARSPGRGAGMLFVSIAESVARDADILPFIESVNNAGFLERLLAVGYKIQPGHEGMEIDGKIIGASVFLPKSVVREKIKV